MTDLALGVGEARDVLAAVVHRIARDAEADVLLIKGPTLAHFGLRSPRSWGDVDILVRPEHIRVLRDALEAAGWAAHDEFPRFPVLAPLHAVTFVHPRWHTEIDLHTFLPGAYADPARVFDALWTERTVLDVAHQQAIATGRLGTALVGALNLARMPHGPRRSIEAREWTAAVTSWADADRRALAVLAARCGAADVVLPIFEPARVPPIGRGQLSDADLADWLDRVGRDSRPGYVWAHALRRAPGWRKPFIVLRALSYDPEATAKGLPQPRGLARMRHMRRRLKMAVDWSREQRS